MTTEEEESFKKFRSPHTQPLFNFNILLRRKIKKVSKNKNSEILLSQRLKSLDDKEKLYKYLIDIKEIECDHIALLETKYFLEKYRSHNIKMAIGNKTLYCMNVKNFKFFPYFKVVK